MRIGIVFIGITWGHGRDFTHCYPNIKETLIDPLSKEHEVSVYVATYGSERADEVLSMYKPKKSTVIDFTGSHQVTTYIKGLELLRGENLDVVITTRFDIHFNQNMAEAPYKLDKFNALFKEKGWWVWWKKLKFTTDNFYVFPYSMLEDFITVLEDMRERPARSCCNDLHHAFYRMRQRLGKGRVNAVSKQHESSHLNNSFYFLCRKK